MLKNALVHWPEMGQQVTYLGLKHMNTKFQVYWNGAISCFVGKDCFGNYLPSQKALAVNYEKDQLHMTFGYGNYPTFQIDDKSQVTQSLFQNYYPITQTSWKEKDIHYEIFSLATGLNPSFEENKTEELLCISKVKIKGNNKSVNSKVRFWLNLSGYKCLVWPKEKLEDSFPPYMGKLQLIDNKIYDEAGNIRLKMTCPLNTETLLHEDYSKIKDTFNNSALLSKKGLLKNLVEIILPLDNQVETEFEIVLPYFPLNPKNEILLKRSFSEELQTVVQYWDEHYRKDTFIQTPETFINNFYKAGLHHIFITTDTEKDSNRFIAKSSPAWYETLWANLAIDTAIALDYRGHHSDAEKYLEPFLEWQGVNTPPNMKNVSMEGFFCPLKEYTAIPWISNHGWILWGLAEHYKITKDKDWLDKIIKNVIAGCDWIIREREKTKRRIGDSDKGGKVNLGYGLLPAGTVSDDKGSGQYFYNDAWCYKGLRNSADMLLEINHPKAERIDQEARQYKNDILHTLEKAVQYTEKIKLRNGESIPYIPNEIHQKRPPEFNPVDFWPYINYVDVGPLHLVDCGILDPNSNIVDWILRFEEEYIVANLEKEISVHENWCFSIQKPGNTLAHLLRHGISVIEPFYAPQATAYFERRNIDKYLEVFYNQLAGAVSHRTLTPVENRHGVWNLPWADSEFLKMLRRMLVHERGDKLYLLSCIPGDWLIDGKIIEVKNLSTYFGNISFYLLCDAGKKCIDLSIQPPLRNPFTEIIITIPSFSSRNVKEIITDFSKWSRKENLLLLTRPFEEETRIKFHY